MNLIVIILFSFINYSNSVQSSDNPVVGLSYDELLHQGITSFYETDWIKAREVFSEMKMLYPDDPRPHFFESMMPFLEYFIVDQSRESAEEFLAISEIAVSLSTHQLKNSPNDTTMVLMLSGLHGYRGLVAASEKNHRVALSSGLTGFNYTRKLLAMDSEKPEARMGRGMFYYMVGSIPSGMRWASNIIGFRADIEDGFEELKKAAESDSYISNDAKMMLMYLFSKEERYEEALLYAERLTEALPDNVIFLFKKAEILEAAGNKEEALNVYKLIVGKNNPGLGNLTESCRKKVVELEKITQNY